MLSNAYFVARFCFDTAENEPAKNLQNFARICPNFANRSEAPTFTGGKGRQPPDPEDGPYILINKEITDSAVDPHRFQAYVTQ